MVSLVFGTLDADPSVITRACFEVNMLKHGSNSFDSHLHVVDYVWDNCLSSAVLANSKIFGSLSPRTRNLQWAIDTYFERESKSPLGLQVDDALLFWDHICTFGSHNFLIITRTHIAHRADYANMHCKWIHSLRDIAGLVAAASGDKSGRRKLRLSSGQEVLLAGALGPELHELVDRVARIVNRRLHTAVLSAPQLLM